MTENPIVVKSESPKKKRISEVYWKSATSSCISRTCFAGSGSQKKIHIKFAVIRKMERRIIPSIPKKVARTPPSAGPTRNAVPKAAPMSPIFFALFSGVDISDI